MSSILRSQPQREAHSTTLQHVSTNLRLLRIERGMSQARLADAAGLSRRMIGAIENGAANVSLATVDRLAAALEVTFTRLVRHPDASDYGRMDLLGWKGRHPGSRAVLLGAAPGGLETELWRWTLAPGEIFESEEIAGSWHEILFVLEGQLSLTWGNRREVIKANDFKIFNSHESYRFSNLESEPIVYIRILVL